MKHAPPEHPDNWKVFAKRLFGEHDADPGYYCIQRADLPYEQKLRIAIGWCTFYHLGVAAKASEYTGKRFWGYLREQYPTAPRASERRHFRGRAGLMALEQWEHEHGTPENMAESFHKPGGAYRDVRKATEHAAQYGPYFAWKWCDLNEVLWGNTLDMRGTAKYSPKVPQEGAELIFPHRTVDYAYEEIEMYGRAQEIDPLIAKRPFGIQEAETVACVYHQYLGGSYTYGSRTAKAIARLEWGPECKTAAAMREALLDFSPYSKKQLQRILEEK